jgi:hypothetical protein
MTHRFAQLQGALMPHRRRQRIYSSADLEKKCKSLPFQTEAKVMQIHKILEPNANIN